MHYREELNPRDPEGRSPIDHARETVVPRSRVRVEERVAENSGLDRDCANQSEAVSASVTLALFRTNLLHPESEQTEVQRRD